MKNLIIIGVLLTWNLIQAATIQTNINGEWSYNGEDPCYCSPNIGDTIIVSHDIHITGNINWDNMVLIVENGAQLSFENEVIFGAGMEVLIEESSSLFFYQDFYTYSENFINYGTINYDEFVYNYGIIISFGTFDAHSEGRKVHNFGQINDLIGGTGPQGDQAYKEEEINNSNPDIVNLPTEWGKVNADREVRNYEINWEVLSENNNRAFYVVATSNFMNIDTLGWISGRGFANETMWYQFSTVSFQDYKFIGVGQEDFDGTQSFGAWVELNIPQDLSYKVEGQQLSIEGGESQHVKIFTLDGSLVIDQNLIERSTLIDLPFSNAYYLVVLQSQNGVEQFKIKI